MLIMEWAKGLLTYYFHSVDKYITYMENQVLSARLQTSSLAPLETNF